MVKNLEQYRITKNKHIQKLSVIICYLPWCILLVEETIYLELKLPN